MHKTERQEKILGIIEASPVRSQAELTERLSDLGFRVTQASVSRDLDELGVVKVNGAYSRPHIDEERSQFGPVTFQTVGDNLIVGKTLSGLASAVTVRIDAADIEQIVGTIAGDDTIFIAVRDHKAQMQALKEITGVFN
jgi:transcriptional regulator of arginine metabolism